MGKAHERRFENSQIYLRHSLKAAISEAVAASP